MAYNFGQKRIRTGNNQERNGGMYTKTIFDTKGDYLETFGSRIPDSMKVVIGNGDAYRTVTSYHNIFAEVMPRRNNGRLVYTPESDEDALEICEQLFQADASDEFTGIVCAFFFIDLPADDTPVIEI